MTPAISRLVEAHMHACHAGQPGWRLPEIVAQLDDVDEGLAQSVLDQWSRTNPDRPPHPHEVRVLVERRIIPDRISTLIATARGHLVSE